MGSIINDKYKGQYRKAEDWLSQLLDKATSKTRTVEKKVKVKGEDGAPDTERVETRTMDDGKDVNALFAIAGENNLDVSKYQKQRESAGFPGRFRMTVGNMLRSSAKKRHGLFIGGTWQAAPADWLAARGAPDEPTEKQSGEKIAKPKPEKPAKAEVEAAPAEDAEAAPKDKRRRRAVHQDAAQ